MHHGQRRLGRARTGAGPSGGAAWRAVRPCVGLDHQQGLRVRAQGGDAGRPGDRDRRRLGRRCGRHGVDEQRAVSAGARARRPAHGARPGHRLDDQRRPLVQLRKLAHGQGRRSRGDRVRNRTAGAGRLRARESPEGGRGHRCRALRRGDPSRDAARRRKARRSSSSHDESIRRDTTLEALPRLAPAFAEGRHGHRGQRASRSTTAPRHWS